METRVKFKCLAIAAATAALLNPAQAQISDNAVRIGVLTDLSGVYSDVSGKGTVVATQMAIDDFVAKERPSFKVEMG
jgi:branched-chain amino acid transport system substrate-binding protein